MTRASLREWRRAGAMVLPAGRARGAASRPQSRWRFSKRESSALPRSPLYVWGQEKKDDGRVFLLSFE
jgi:hypothetical protein